MKAILAWIGGLALSAAAIGILNVALWAGQNAWPGAGRTRLEQLKTELDASQTRISVLRNTVEASEARIRNEERGVQAIDKEIDEDQTLLRQRARWIQRIERAHPLGIPSADYAQYKRNVETHNQLVASLQDQTARRDMLYKAYTAAIKGHNDNVVALNSLVEAHNVKAREANALARSVGSNWYLVPTPGFSRRRR